MHDMTRILSTNLSGLVMPAMAEKPAAVMAMKMMAIRSALSTLAVKYFERPREIRKNKTWMRLYLVSARNASCIGERGLF